MKAKKCFEILSIFLPTNLSITIQALSLHLPFQMSITPVDCARLSSPPPNQPNMMIRRWQNSLAHYVVSLTKTKLSSLISNNSLTTINHQNHHQHKFSFCNSNGADRPNPGEKSFLSLEISWNFEYYLILRQRRRLAHRLCRSPTLALVSVTLWKRSEWLNIGSEKKTTIQVTQSNSVLVCICIAWELYMNKSVNKCD